MPDRDITELAGTPRPQRDLQWLKDALQSAIKLEFFTIPPYLTALWSIKNQRESAALAVREVLIEEMLHMSLACNMLKAIGGRPKICHPDVVPKYPNPLPGGVKPELSVPLQGLSYQSLHVFMEIEAPEQDISQIEAVPGFEEGDTYQRIGEFYDAIEEAFIALDPEFTRGGQVEGYFGEARSRREERTPRNIGSLDDVRAAIALIKDQGEGTSQQPLSPDTGEPAHYYRFKEIVVGRRVEHVPGRGWVHSGEPISMPDCWPVAEIPEGGYRLEQVPAVVWNRLQQFDAIYTELLVQLEAAWQTGHLGSLHRGMELMMDRLPALAREIMQSRIDNTPFHYGPCFRLLKEDAA